MSLEILHQPYEERSRSKRHMDAVVNASFSRNRYLSYIVYGRWMRAIDNVVDEGPNYDEAKKVVDKQIDIVAGKSVQHKDSVPAYYDEALTYVLNKASPEHAKEMKKSVLGLLDYFSVDLEHRHTLTAFSRSDLDRHIDGGFPLFYQGIKLILYNKPLRHQGFWDLARIHGKTETLGDLEEDMDRGFLPHDMQKAVWVHDLRPGEKLSDTTIHKIDEYIGDYRGPLADRMKHLAPYAFVEFPTFMGALWMAEYIRRSYLLRLKRFQPKGDIVFARLRIA